MANIGGKVLSALFWRAVSTDDAERGRVARQALEPIHCAIALSLLSVMPAGTKLSIKDHEVAVQPHEPLQGYTRTRNGDSFEDLTMLRRPLRAFGALYQVAEGDRKAALRIILQAAMKGLGTLVTTYQNISRQNAHLITKFKAVRDLAELYSKYLSEAVTDQGPTDNECGYAESLQLEFDPIWTTDNLKEVCTLLQLSQSVIGTTRSDAMLVPIKMILDEKLEEITRIITLYQRGGEE